MILPFLIMHSLAFNPNTKIDCKHVALLILKALMMLIGEKVLQLLLQLLWFSIWTCQYGLHLLLWFFSRSWMTDFIVRNHPLVIGRNPKFLMCFQTLAHLHLSPLATLAHVAIDPPRSIYLGVISRTPDVDSSKVAHWIALILRKTTYLLSK